MFYICLVKGGPYCVLQKKKLDLEIKSIFIDPEVTLIVLDVKLSSVRSADLYLTTLPLELDSLIFF